MDTSSGVFTADVTVGSSPWHLTLSPDGTELWVANANDDNRGSGHHPPPEGEKHPGSVTVFDARTRQVVSVTEVPNFARFLGFLP